MEKPASSRLLFLLICSFLLPATGMAQKKELTYQQIFGDTPTHISKTLPDIMRWIDDDHYLERKAGEGLPVWVSVEARTGKETPYSHPVTETDITVGALAGTDSGADTDRTGENALAGTGADVPADAVDTAYSPDGK